MGWLIIGGLALCVLVVYSCLRINAPRTKQEEREAFERDCAEFDKYMAGKKNGGRK